YYSYRQNQNLTPNENKVFCTPNWGFFFTIERKKNSKKINLNKHQKQKNNKTQILIKIVLKKKNIPISKYTKIN
ncbi:hypothetical protein ACTHRR_11105, partial [Neisseria sp. P0003.S003]|uniref:hypothetical protein n=1 Tax=Neisseria sp. P0003.S003 TaxID=3436658 RepID=UPI003F818294